MTSPQNGGTAPDVDAQIVKSSGLSMGGFDAALGGAEPWSSPLDAQYLLAQNRERPHTVTDSASSATSMAAGIKTYNGAINVDAQGRQVRTMAHALAEQGFAVGVVTNVPISHATPAAAYANNVSRGDYQDLTRDLLGLPSRTSRVSG